MMTIINYIITIGYDDNYELYNNYVMRTIYTLLIFEPTTIRI